MTPLPEPVSLVLADVVRWARGRFGARLGKLALFGSFARGEGTLPESDVDVLLVVQALTRDELVEVVGEVARISCDHNVLVSPLALSRARYDELCADDRLLAREIERDGRAL